MDDLLIRRRELILPSSGSAPLYPLDGTYTFGPIIITISDSHWHIAGSGSANNQVIFGYPDELFKNIPGTYKVEVSNMVMTSGDGTSQYLRIGTPGSPDLFDAFTISDGNGTYTQEHTFTLSYQNLIRIYISFGWKASFDYDFDLKLYFNDEWIS